MLYINFTCPEILQINNNNTTCNKDNEHDYITDDAGHMMK